MIAPVPQSQQRLDTPRRPWIGKLSIDLRKGALSVSADGLTLIDEKGVCWAIVFSDKTGFYDHAALIVDAVNASGDVRAAVIEPTDGHGHTGEFTATEFNERAWDHEKAAKNGLSAGPNVSYVRTFQACAVALRYAAKNMFSQSHATDAAGGWQSIETAPKDGTPVLLLRVPPRDARDDKIVGFYDVPWKGWYTMPGHWGCNPTRWMPLPASFGGIA